MINYEGSVRVQDAVNYWSGAWCWYYDNETRKVTAYTLYIDSEEARSGDLLDDWECAAEPIDRNDRTLFPTGCDLFSSNNWKIQRFPVEYVPIGTDYVVRLNLSPINSRMFKGYGGRHLRTLPLVDNALPPKLAEKINAVLRASEEEHFNVRMEMQEDGSIRVFESEAPIRMDRVSHALATGESTQMRDVDYAEVVMGIASVLEIGLPPVMRNVMSLNTAQDNSRRAVKQFMLDAGRRVLVPSFDIACIKHRANPKEAIVLRNGALFGTLKRSETETHPVFYPYVSSTMTDRDLKRLLKKSGQRVAENILTPSVEWGI